MENKIQMIRYSHNAMRINSIEAFGNIRGGFRQNCRTVYFVRALGVAAGGREGYTKEILKLDRAMLERMRQGTVIYKRIAALPGILTTQDTAYYTDCFRKWSDSGRKLIETRTTVKGLGLPETLGRALAETIHQYRLIKPGISDTIEKNFAVKLMFWFDFIMNDLQFHWDEKSCVKLAVHNVTKEQEYLFYYLLTLVGVDVLLLQSRADIALSPPLKKLSAELVLGEYCDLELPDFSPAFSEEVTPPVRSAPHLPTKAKETAKTEKSFEELALLASSVVMITIHDDKGKPIGSGSGIMVGSKGYILTNSHVACGGKFYTVKIEDDDRTYQTEEIIKYNQVLDLAIIRIDRTLNPLPVYKGARKLVRGQKVVAIGSPLGLFNSVSDGIISGFRSIGNVDMIQFTAPISHGSSGGALLNMYGEVIGISTAGIDDGQNINLAVGYEFINLFINGFE